MVKLNRYFLVIIAVLVFAIVIPGLYWTIFEKPVKVPNLYYSCITNDFMIIRPSPEGTSWEDSKGKQYSRGEFEQTLPFLYTSQLVTNELMPDSINGVGMDVHAIMRARGFYRYAPKTKLTPRPNLYPLFESESGRVNLEMPGDYFRIHQSIEFIDAKTNKVKTVKSKLFNQELVNTGFVFPARQIAGIPTIRKTVDEGYFIIDRDGKLYHLKMVKGEPFVVLIDRPENLEIDFIECTDVKSREYYCYIFSKSGEVYILAQEVYEFIKLPIGPYDFNTHSLRVFNDLFNKCISVYGNNYVHCYAVDDMYGLVKSYKENWNNKYVPVGGKVFSFLFPLQLRVKKPESDYTDFYITKSPGYYWLILNLLLLLVTIVHFYRKQVPFKNYLFDVILVAVFGLFGYGAILVFPNKFYEHRKNKIMGE